MSDFVDHDALNRVGRAKAVLEHGARFQVAQLGLDKGAQIARGAVLHFEDKVQLVVVLDDHARTHLSGGNRHKKKTPCCACVSLRKNIGCWSNLYCN